MKPVTEYTEYRAIVEKYRQKGVRSNDYIQQEAENIIDKKALYVDYYENNVFLFVIKEIGMRMYYYINDLQEKANFNDYKDIVIEILFRTNIPQEEVDYFTQCGFQVNLVRDQYFGVYKDLNLFNIESNIQIEEAKNIEEVKLSCELFNNSFDKLSGDYINSEMYPFLLGNRSIWIAWDLDKKTFLGALHQSKEKNVNWISHVAVVAEARGQKMGPSLVKAFIENNKVDEKTRYMFWVQRQNEPAVKMYQQFGFKYMNKSTISLIK